MKLKEMIFTTDVELPPTHHLLTIPKCYFPILQISMTFLVVLEGIRIEKRPAAEGHTNPTPKCTFHMWAQMEAWEVDGPLFAALNLTSVCPFDAPSQMWRGCR